MSFEKHEQISLAGKRRPEEEEGAKLSGVSVAAADVRTGRLLNDLSDDEKDPMSTTWENKENKESKRVGAGEASTMPDSVPQRAALGPQLQFADGQKQRNQNRLEILSQANMAPDIVVVPAGALVQDQQWPSHIKATSTSSHDMPQASHNNTSHAPNVRYLPPRRSHSAPPTSTTFLPPSTT
jgi:hypothetical protein